MSAIERLTSRFKSWTGYCEKKSREYLDDFTRNAGSGNYTCFGRDFTKLVNDGYDWNGEPWCDEYVDMNFVYEFGEDTARKLLGGFNAYTPASAQYFKNMGRWHTSNPREGDVIFFKNSSGICHTGYVTGCDGIYVYTNEGNTSSGSTLVANGGCVANKSYSLSYSRIAGYGRPDYSIVEEDTLMSREYEELKNTITTQQETINRILAVLESTFIYNWVDDNMPDWAKDAVTAAIKSGGVEGNEKGELNLSYKDLRNIVREYRQGLYDKPAVH